jgi:hypothetical protein
MTETSGLTIYHNPACGTSRNTLALLKDKGLDPHVVEYLKVGWTREGLTQLLTQMDAGPRANGDRRPRILACSTRPAPMKPFWPPCLNIRFWLIGRLSASRVRPAFAVQLKRCWISSDIFQSGFLQSSGEVHK